MINQDLKDFENRYSEPAGPKIEHILLGKTLFSLKRFIGPKTGSDFWVKRYRKAIVLRQFSYSACRTK